jgi:hypothetical protein
MGYEATIFTDDAVKLGDELGTEVTKTAALEINRFVSIGGGPESADFFRHCRKNLDYFHVTH